MKQGGATEAAPPSDCLGRLRREFEDRAVAAGACRSVEVAGCVDDHAGARETTIGPTLEGMLALVGPIPLSSGRGGQAEDGTVAARTASPGRAVQSALGEHQFGGRVTAVRRNR